MTHAAIRWSIADRREWNVLAALHGIVGIGAVGGGLALATGTSGLSEQYLDGSRFSSFLIPGLALTTLVGGSSLLAAAAVWRRRDRALDASALASLVLTGWFAVQLAEVGMISWLQPFFMAVLVTQTGLALHLRTHSR